MKRIKDIQAEVAEGKQVTVAPGIVVRSNGFRISFTIQGQRRSETLLLELTKPNLRYAIDTRAAILREIQLTGTFDYFQYFPNGRTAHHYGITVCRTTVETALNEFLKVMKDKVAFSTWDDYRKSVKNILIPAFGKILLADLSTRDIQEWVNARTSRAKRTRNVLTPLRDVLDEAARTERIPRNPLTNVQIKDHAGSQAVKEADLDEELEDENEVDPYSLAEMSAILSSIKPIPQFYNLIEFAFWTGLRTSELIALRWQHVDFEAGNVRIRIAKVKGKFKRPKTKAGRRTIRLLPAALAALKRQYKFTGKAGKEVFHHPRLDVPWSGDKPIRESYWRPALKQAGVRYRKPYQTRHTYASMLLSSRENPMWVAQQMGHEDWGMIRKHYGKWLPDYDQDAGARTVAVWDAHVKSMPKTCPTS